MMRILFVVTLVAALGWSGYWFVGATAKQATLESWFVQQRAQGWVADNSELQVRGYPNRFDTTIQNLDLADPNSGWSWTAPWFQILALSYQPNHVIAVWPPKQTIASPNERIEVDSERIRGSVRFTPNTGLALQQAIIELVDIHLDSSLGWDASLSEGQLAIRRSPPGVAPDYGYDVNLEARLLRLPEPLKRQLDPADLLPDALARADIRLTPVYSAPWDRVAVETGPPDLMTLNVGNVSFRWGGMELTVTGRLDSDARGYAVGELNVIARNWREMLEVSVRAGWVPSDMAGTLETALALVAQMTGQTDRLDVTVNYEDGFAKIGPVPVGIAPRLHIPGR